jgi:hypothetical protein
MHRKILDGKAFVNDVRHVYAVKFLVLHVNDVLAYPADQMMMATYLPVETRCGSGVVKAADNAHVCQRIEDTINGRPRDSRSTVRDHIEDLVRRRMIVPLKNCLEHDPTLHREGDALTPAQRLELLQSLRDLVRLHRHNVWNIMLYGTKCQNEDRQGIPQHVARQEVELPLAFGHSAVDRYQLGVTSEQRSFPATAHANPILGSTSGEGFGLDFAH